MDFWVFRGMPWCVTIYEVTLTLDIYTLMQYKQQKRGRNMTFLKVNDHSRRKLLS